MAYTLKSINQLKEVVDSLRLTFEIENAPYIKIIHDAIEKINKVIEAQKECDIILNNLIKEMSGVSKPGSTLQIINNN